MNSFESINSDNAVCVAAPTASLKKLPISSIDLFPNALIFFPLTLVKSIAKLNNVAGSNPSIIPPEAIDLSDDNNDTTILSDVDF